MQFNSICNGIVASQSKQSWDVSKFMFRIRSLISVITIIANGSRTRVPDSG